MGFSLNPVSLVKSGASVVSSGASAVTSTVTDAVSGGVDTVKSGANAVTRTATGVVSDGVNTVKSGAGAVVRAGTGVVSSGANAVTGAVSTGANVIRDTVELSANALNGAKDFAVDAGAKVGNGIRSIPGYDIYTKANSFVAENTLGRAANFIRENSVANTIVGGAVAGPLGFIPGGFGSSIREGAAGFVADTLDIPGNIQKDPAGVVQAAVTASIPGGQLAITEGLVEDFRENVNEYGVAGAVTHSALDVGSFFVPGGGAVSTTANALSIADIGRGAIAQQTDDDPNGFSAIA